MVMKILNLIGRTLLSRCLVGNEVFFWEGHAIKIVRESVSEVAMEAHRGSETPYCVFNTFARL